MELKQFVKEALLNITNGVEEANLIQNRFRIIGMKRNEGGIDGNDINFDVSVSIEQKSSGDIGAKTGVSFLNVISADFNSKMNESNIHQNVNHLNFKIWVSENEFK